MLYSQLRGLGFLLLPPLPFYYLQNMENSPSVLFEDSDYSLIGLEDLYIEI